MKMQRGFRLRLQSMLFGASVLLLAAQAVAQERVGSKSQPLTTTSDAINWTTQNNEVPVCWETPGFDREKAIVRDAVSNTWERFANIRFTGWHACPTGIGIGGSGSAKNVRIRIHAQDASNAGAGGSARVGTAALSSADENNPGVDLSFNPDGTADEGRVEYVAVHEFGHVLGFIHEQDAPGNEGPAKCNQGVDSDANPVPITVYDRDSIMNYCTRDGNSKGNLTDIDIAGVQQIYGVRSKNVASVNPCQSGQLKARASLADAWNDSAQTSIAVFPSDGTKFLYPTQRSVRQGGWGDTVKWAAGDFTGDGKTDMVAAWNNNGNATLTMRASTGSGFNVGHWIENAGGWVETSVYLPGDFDGDRLTDLAVAWNDNNNTSVAVYKSDGSKFLPPAPWGVRDGGWGDTVKWVAGDFNGDGKTDLGAAWDNNGVTTLTVRLSNGSKFTPVHWSANAGNWWDSSVFVAGDFNGDGRADIAQLWNDLGNNSVKVSLADVSGTKFAPAAAWATRDGGWGGVIKWMPGDFNGDGRTDIAAAWNNGGTNTLTVRTSNGSKMTPAHWATNVGGWIDTSAWCAGNFD